MLPNDIHCLLRWVFKQLYDRGMVYRGYKVMPYSTACSTPLSNFEAGQNYKDVIDPASKWWVCPWWAVPVAGVCMLAVLLWFRLVFLQSLSTFHWRKTLTLASSPGQPLHGPSLATWPSVSTRSSFMLKSKVSNGALCMLQSRDSHMIVT